jgi:hypothetical protein
MPSLAEHLNWYTKQWWHRRVARGVLGTPPIVPADDGVVLFAMVGSAVLHPYLVAVKSLHRGLGGIGRVALIDDGTLTLADRALLDHHLCNPDIIPIASVDTGTCPRGGTWERLLAILDLRRDAYVIQADSDTVTLGDLPEVREAIAAKRSFTLRGEASAEIDDARAFAKVVDLQSPELHVQDAAESVVGQLVISGPSNPRHVRGCSGFAGFAPAEGGRGLAEAFSCEMERLIGRSRWERWGSEQVASNFVIANELDPLLLPYDGYLNYWNQGVPEDARFVHFIGTCRFDGLAYLEATRTAIRQLSDQPRLRTSATASRTAPRAPTHSTPA